VDYRLVDDCTIDDPIGLIMTLTIGTYTPSSISLTSSISC